MTTLIKYWKAILVFFALIAFGLMAHTNGKLGERKKWETKEVITQRAIAELKAKQAAKTVEIVTEYVDRVQIVKEKGQTIIKEVPVYVQNDADLSGGFRVFHDAAASNELPDPTRIADAPTVPIEDAATTIAENYQGCHENVEQLIALQKWIMGTPQREWIGY